VKDTEDWERSVATSGMPPLRSRRRAGDEFRARLVAGELGPLRLAELVTPASDCFRDARSVRAADYGLCQIDVIVDGHARAEQYGRQAELGRADLVVIDPARPVRFTSSATTSVTILVPRRLLGLGPDDLALLVRGAHPRRPRPRCAGVLAGPRHGTVAGRIPGRGRGPLGGAVVDLIAVALRAQLGRPRPATDEELRTRILTFIEARLPDRDLSPVSIAAAHHTSVRRLHQLFEVEPVTVAALIRRLRLERCRGDLADPAHRRLPVAAIAARWGFPDPAHFSRLFKAAYGRTAAELRTLR
jgi:AraC-like DNA-binding protein